MEYIDKWVRLLLIMTPHILLIGGTIVFMYKQTPGWGYFLAVTALYVLFCSIKVE